MTVAPTPHLRRVGFGVTIAGLVVIAFATLLPAPPGPAAAHLCLICGTLGTLDAILNVILFIPLGVGLALAGVPGKRALLAMCALSAAIEIAQLLLIPGRDSTVGDVLMNTLGGTLGFVIARYSKVWLRPPPGIAKLLLACSTLMWLSVQALSSFGFALFLPRSVYYGEIARALGNFPLFSGRVLSAHVGDAVVVDGRFEGSPTVRELLLEAAPLTVIVVPANPTHDIAPIVRLADSRQREIVLLGQNEGDLIFRVRTGTAAVRLRSPVFALSNAFPPALPTDGWLTTDTVTASARYSTHGVSLVAETGRTIHQRRIPITASLGWTMVLPLQWYIQGTLTERLFSAIWIGVLLLPVGYWGVGTVVPARAEQSFKNTITRALVMLSLLYVGLVAVPHLFGIASARTIEWVAAVTAVLLGGALGLSVASRSPKDWLARREGGPA